MKKLVSLSVIAMFLVAFSFSNIFAQDSLQIKNQKRFKNKGKVTNQAKNNIQHGRRFVDENGDGYNDNAPDADGDGIPNGLDPDYQGPKMQKGKKGSMGFVDMNGDGINDNAGMGRGKMSKGKKGGFGPGNRTGNQGVKPQNGTGYGNGAGTGNCDGTGPKGNQKGARRQGGGK